MIQQMELNLNKLQSSKASLSHSKSNLIQSGNAMSNHNGTDLHQMESIDNVIAKKNADLASFDGQDVISGQMSPSSNRIEVNSGLLNRDLLAAKDSIVGNYYVPHSRLQPYQDIMSKNS